MPVSALGIRRPARAGQVIADFLDDLLSRPDAWCVAEMGPPEWFVPDLYQRR